ncbi:DUF2127 domain-containing protein [Methylovorus glucosotrophus]|jgi:uncharacterized membrane protein (DUF2068 family)|uniref:DUF2127 domain-containing protein n=1 Tax=Methylovorus glucosotrophus (strain SIP3-4) TaxID=582744 RepID=C6XAY6_METGS|nr:DUF2127 domain-containing protein [Methylovorus glucosotrophus]ACT51756.1 conserved hypothetical protein [Methylovorus glucosotrophus SIP3-4]
MKSAASLRSIALLEAAKGALILLTALAVLTHLHTDWQAAAEQLVAHFHLNPARQTPRFLLQLAADVSQPRLLAITAGALAYVGLRWAEAYGLWYDRPWAKWLGLISAGVYLPFEVVEILRQPSVLSYALLLINLGIVIILWRHLRK